MATISITGTVSLSPDGSPISNAVVEMWDDGGTYGRLYTVEANSEGQFTFIIFDPIKSMIEAEPTPTIVPKYKVYVSGQLVLEETITYVVAEEIALIVNQGDFDAVETDSSILVQGVLLDSRKNPITGRTINVYETGFRQKFLLAKTTTRTDGTYSIQIYKKDLNNVPTVARKSISTEAIQMDDDNNIIASSGSLFIGDNKFVIANLQTNDDFETLPTFAKLQSVISGVIDGNDIASIEFDPNSGDDELAYAAKAAGKSKDDLVMIVNAYKYAAEVGVESKFLYPLLAQKGDNGTITGNPIMKMREQEMRDAIEDAVNRKLIGHQEPMDIDNFIDAAKTYQVNTIKTSEVGSEEITVNDVLLSVFSNQTEVDNYLAVANQAEYGTVDEFWSEYESQYGSTLTESAQKGLQVATITGYQPELTAHIMTELGSNALSVIATWGVSDWATEIAAVCTANTSLCVPKILKDDETDPGATEVHEKYAKILAGTVQNMYPLMNIKGELEGVDGPLLIPDSTTRSETITFIDNNPRFDLRISSITDLDDGTDLTDITDINAVAEALAPFQRIIRLTVGNPEAVTALVKAGIGSAMQIAEMSEETFIENYGSLFESEDSAMELYAKALSTSELAKNYLINALTSSGGNIGSSVIPKMDFSNDAGGSTVAHPDLTTMFGNMDYCSCDQCSSMYSPTAYFVDILNYIKTTSGPAYAELTTRRPDLLHIDLTCKNANTALPYVDLVNELLEKMALEDVGVTLPAQSFQTSGTASQLAAYPEHVYKDGNNDYINYSGYTRVYENDPSTTNGVLNNAYYPHNLPFSLPIEETRSYLKYLGVTRTEMMRLFRPYMQSSYTASNEVTDYSIFADKLGFNKNAIDVITLAHAESANTYKFYGFTSTSVSNWPDPVDSSVVFPTTAWYDLLTGRVDVLLLQAEISYRELLQILVTDFMNPVHSSGTPHRDVNIVARTAVSPEPPIAEDTCKLNQLRLDFNVDNNITKQEFLGRLYRFVRLYKSGELSIYEWDVLLKSFNITELDSVAKPSINGENRDFELIGRALLLSQKMNLRPEVLAAGWSDISIAEYIDYSANNRDTIKSVYSTIFDNNNVLNNPSYNPFKDHDSLSSLQYGDHTAAISAYCLIGESDLISLLSYLDIDSSDNIDLTQLSRIYFLTQVARFNELDISELISICNMSGILNSVNDFMNNPPDSSGSPTYTYTHYLDLIESLSDKITAIYSSGFSVSELDYLVTNIDHDGNFFPFSLTVGTFYETLRDSLLKLPLYVDPSEDEEEIANAQVLLNQYINIIYQEFSKQFNVPSRWVKAFMDIDTVTTETLVADSFSMKIVKDALFRSTVEDSFKEGAVGTEEYYSKFRQIHKAVYIASKLKLKSEDFSFIYTNGLQGGGVLGLDFESLFTEVDDAYLPLPLTDPVDLFEAILRLSRLAEIKSRLKFVDGDLAEYLSLEYDETDASDKKQAWLDFFDRKTKWGGMLEELVGDSSITEEPTAGASSNLLRLTYIHNASPSLDEPSSFVPNSYKNLSLLITIDKIVLQCKLIGLTPLSVQKTLRPDVNLQSSQSLLLAAKGKQSDESWQKVAKPLRDTIRQKQRDALTAYILANPPSGNQYPWRNKNDLFAYLLIDVEMEPVMLTSRTKQAISAVQLFVDRALMRLESTNGNPANPIDITANLAFKHQWKTWRKWYSIWAANRQIFLYPENWLVPDLRDDKTEFFKELQNDLLQEEATEDSVDRALRNYLHKLDEVSYLEPVGVCDTIDPTTNECITHAFARTYGNPQHYFYRKMIGDEWTGWEKMDIDIKSDHIAPIVWNNRLYVFWITFLDRKIKAVPGPNSSNPKDVGGYDWLIQHTGGYNCMWFYNDPLSSSEEPDPNESNARYYHQLEITLNWTEYKDNKWEKQRIGKDTIKMNLNPFATKDFHQLLDFATYQRNDNQGIIPYYSFLTGNQTESFIDLTKARFYLYPQIPSDFMGRPYTNGLKVHLLFPTQWNTANEPGMFHVQSFEFPDPGLEPIVSRYTSSFLHQLAPVGTANKNMRFVEYQPWSNSGSKLFLDEYGTGTTPSTRYIYNREKIETVSGFPTKNRASAKVILDQIASTRGDFKILSKTNFQRNPLENQFFYTDDTNTFFVRAIGMTTGMWLANANAPTQYFNAGADKGLTTATTYGGGSVKFTPSLSAPTGYATNVRFDPGTVLFSGAGTIEAVPTINFKDVSFASTDVPAVGYVISGGGVAKGDYGTVFSTKPDIVTPVKYVPYLPVGPVNVSGAGPATYYFQTFYHPHVQSFIRALYTGGLPKLLDIKLQSPNDTLSFSSQYSPTSIVYNKDPWFYPDNKVDFSYMGAYSIYNWELFFHVPMLIAQSLSNNQKFEEAQKWFHYIFNPTNTKDIDGTTTISSKKRFWNCKPFYDMAGKTIGSIEDLLLDVYNNNGTGFIQANKMQKYPFQPYVISRLRVESFMKHVVIKYVDNLIAWGDSLFARNTIESINEATQLYILASNILGVKPQEVPKRAVSATYTFSELLSTGKIDTLGNARVAIENFIDYNAGLGQTTPTTSNSNTPIPMFYFCVPENKEMLNLWDTVADRLYKIRNSLNLQGQLNKLPLFEPPVNPALLVQAAASGVDINSVLDDISGASLPNYRFPFVYQKANEFCGDVKALGGALLSALEKKDAEELSLIRSGLEYKVLDSALQMKKTQLNEANANMEALLRSREVTDFKMAYYRDKKFNNDREREHIKTLNETIQLQKQQATMSAISSGMALIPQFHVQAIAAVGPSFGGQQLSTIFQAISTRLGFESSMKSTSANIASTVAGHERRWEDWRFQYDSAVKELANIDQQIIAAKIRIEITEKDIRSQEIQIENNRETDEFMRSKYTNKELYSWMITQISSTYFQAYQLAYQMAKKAGKCYDNELPFAKQSSSEFIKFGYWDSLKKGLLAGEKLQLDLRKLDTAYIESNARELELTKHVSLGMLNPSELLKLKDIGTCEIEIKDWMYNLDYPGHYNRRLKSVSITIPCVTGPYTTVAAELSLSEHKTYNETNGLVFSGTTGGFIATSSAQNDNGLFDFSFKDERYLPFEGKGAESKWTLSLMGDKELRQFDFNTISDVILHIKYTAHTGGKSIESTVSNIKGLLNASPHPFPRYFSVKHEFSNAWGGAFNSTVENSNENDVARLLSLSFRHDQFPFYCQGKNVTIKKINLFITPSHLGEEEAYKIESDGLISGILSLSSPSYMGSTNDNLGIVIEPGAAQELSFKLYKVVDSTDVTVDEEEFKDFYVVVEYNVAFPDPE